MPLYGPFNFKLSVKSHMPRCEAGPVGVHSAAGPKTYEAINITWCFAAVEERLQSIRNHLFRVSQIAHEYLLLISVSR